MTDTYVVDKQGHATILKDPQAILDYTFDWTAWLDEVGDTIASKVLTVESDLAEQSSSISAGNKKVIVWISGGTVGRTLKVACRITTNSTPARVDERTIYLRIVER